tara:strand:- start:4888 stop:6150 length:1263 start_codon:yes stop_codon:yes gene_type:complete
MRKLHNNCSAQEWLDFYFRVNSYSYDFKEFLKIFRSRFSRFDCLVITVGGTNGKGSCVAALSAIYKQAGYRVAAYTSPHLMSVHERLLIDGKPLSDAVWSKALAWVNTLPFPGSIFAVKTLAALFICQQYELDCMILEVGLGGRFDPVNAVSSDLAIVTQIAKDHTNRLGHTLDEIAYHKSGIFKSNRIALIGDSEHGELLVNQARSIGAYIECIGEDFNLSVKDGDWTFCNAKFSCSFRGKLPISPASAATALQAVFRLQHQLPVSFSVIERAFNTLSLPGRQAQALWHGPVWLDVCHNPSAFASMVQRLQDERCQKITWVLGIKRDKDLTGCLSEIIPIADVIYVVSDLEDMHQYPDVRSTAINLGYPQENVRKLPRVGLMKALCRLSHPEHTLVICGSFLLVGMVKQEWRQGFACVL